MKESVFDFECMTNADRIRSMTDEELAEWLGTNIYNSGENIINCDNPPTLYCCDDCKKCYLIWLKEVVEQ